MAAYVDFVRISGEANPKPELKRVYWLCGSERMLVERVLDRIRDLARPSEFDHVSTSAAVSKSKEIWAHANQYPMDSAGRRLVVIRDAEKIRDWRPLDSWMDSRAIPQTVLAFVSNDRGDEKKYTEAEHIARIVKTGRYVRCARLNADAASQFLMGLGTIDEGTARRLFERVGGNLAEAEQVMTKLSYFGGSVTDEHVKRLTPPILADEFGQLLIEMRKSDALEVLNRTRPLGRTETSRVIGQLGSDLDACYALHVAAARGVVGHKLDDAAKIHRVRRMKLEKAARNYDFGRWRSCTSALHAADVATRRGAEEGVLEVLVASW